MGKLGKAAFGRHREGIVFTESPHTPTPGPHVSLLDGDRWREGLRVSTQSPSWPGSPRAVLKGKNSGFASFLPVLCSSLHALIRAVLVGGTGLCACSAGCVTSKGESPGAQGFITGQGNYGELCFGDGAGAGRSAQNPGDPLRLCGISERPSTDVAEFYL